MSQPRVAVIILNWNRLNDILECLQSVSSLDYPSKEVIVVDNGSTDGSTAVIKERFPEVTIICNGKNLGFAGGNNIGIRHALYKQADYVWLLNNDVVAEPDSLSRLVDGAVTLANAGLLSPAIYFHNNPCVVQFPGSYIDWHRFDTIFCTEKQIESDEGIARNVILWGTALLIKTSVFSRVGLLDEKYFAYDEDVDFCIRANRAGFRGYPISAAKVYHKDTPLRGNWKSTQQALLRTRNRYLLWMTHLSAHRKAAFFRHYMTQLVWQVREMEFAQQYSLANASYKGFWNAILRRGGDPALAMEVPVTVRRLLRWMTEHPWFWKSVFSGDYLTAGTGALKRFLNR